MKMVSHARVKDAANAYRHAMWNALLTKSFGADDTQIWTDAHEDWPPEVMMRDNGGGFTRGEHTEMDLHNNAIGRSVVTWNESVPTKEISDRILEKLREGEMVYIVDYHWYDDFVGTASAK